jgi:hypothetical protein
MSAVAIRKRNRRPNVKEMSDELADRGAIIPEIATEALTIRRREQFIALLGRRHKPSGIGAGPVLQSRSFAHRGGVAQPPQPQLDRVVDRRLALDRAAG